MISVTEARDLVQAHVKLLTPQKLYLMQAAGLTLAADVFSPGDFPPFRQSAMDGYSFNFDEWRQRQLPVAGVMPAGAGADISVNSGEAVRIFTGAPVPAQHDTVVMQEKTSEANGTLNIIDENLQPGANVRNIGAEIQAGQLALAAGTYLSPGAIGFLAGMGITGVSVSPHPRATILVTGKELQLPGNPLQYGQVYESNSYTLTAALNALGVKNIQVQVIDDDPQLLTSAISSALETSDLLLLTGGVSVGDYDFVSGALQQAGADIIFHKVKQRPGKPLLFATKGDKVIFGLPGNPSSVLTCFYEYVTIAVQKMINQIEPFLKTALAPVTTEIKKNTSLTHFLKASFFQQQVTPLTGQESFKMNSFATANCLLVLPEGEVSFSKGDLVEVHFLT